MKAIEPLDMDMVDAVISKKQIIIPEEIKDTYIRDRNDEINDIDKLPKGYQIIDLRTPKEAKGFLLTDAIHIPFQQAWAEYLHWDKEKKYFLVCQVGSQSKMLSEYMKKDGFQVKHLESGIKQSQKSGVNKQKSASL